MTVIGFIINTLLFILACAFAVAVNREGKAKRVPLSPPGTLGLYELAYLAGGPARAADVALLAAHARGTVAITADGRVSVQRPDNADLFAADAVAAVQADGSATLAAARTTLADRPSVRGLRERLFGLGFLNPAARNPRLRPARIVLAVIPVLAIAGLFVDAYAGSPGDGVWVANLVLVILGAAAAGGMAYLLFSRYYELRSPLTETAKHYLGAQLHDGQGLSALASAVPGGAALGPVALGGAARVADPGLRAAFGQAAHGTSGQIPSDGWTEQHWADSTRDLGLAGGPTYLDLHRQAVNPYVTPPQQPPYTPDRNLGFQVPPPGGHGAPQYGAYTDGPPVWENAPGADGPAAGDGDPA